METLNVLVTDDEAGMRAGIARALHDHRVFVPEVNGEVAFAVAQAGTGEEALERIEREPPDLLLLDHKMPGMSGLEVLERLSGQSRDMLTIMITAYASIEIAVVATRRGAFDFLPKPFTPDEVRDAVHKAATRLLLARQAKRLADEKRRVRFEFVRVLGHELKAPLAAVSGVLELLRARALGGDVAAYDEAVARGLARVEGMNRLIRDLLDLTRIESGDKHRQPVPLDLRALAASALEAVAPQAAARRVTLELRPGPALAATADATEIEMILGNLLSNAVKYNRDGGHVELALARTGAQVVITVSDTGIGMSAEDRARVFEEFARVRRPETAHVEGTGLGLSIVRKLAQLYGGRASVESEPGRGTTVTVVLHTEPATDEGGAAA